LVLIYIFIVKSVSSKLSELINHIQNNENSTLENINIQEINFLHNNYNDLREKLLKEIELNSNLLKENKRFIADTVHQIRTPLTNIMMNGEMVKKFQKDDSLSSFIDKIDASINMLSNSYEDLSYITTSDTIEYPATKVNISSMLKNRIKFFSTISKVNKKEIISNIEDDIFIYINQIELERIIDNNISNGIKYATKDELIIINLFKNTDFIILEFKTFGNPIQNKNRVFEKNYRESEAKRGLGLGLNMVKNICDKYETTYSVTYKDNQNIFIYTFKKM
jgi:signal transduction histidine kinase